VLDDLVHLGRVRPAELGVRALPLAGAAERWVAADRIADRAGGAGSAAEHAGLRVAANAPNVGNTPIMLGGDLIVAVDGQPMRNNRTCRT